METGRKFWMCLIGIACTMIRPDAAAEITAIVIAFCGGNAVISVAHAKSSKVEEVTNRLVEEGYEPTP